RCSPGDHAAVVAFLHGDPAHRIRRLRPGAVRGVPRGRAAVQDRLGQGKAKGRADMTTRRITPLAPDQAPPEVAPIFETYQKERGNIPNMFRTVALRPSHLRTMIAHLRTGMSAGTTSPTSSTGGCAAPGTRGRSWRSPW